MISKEMVHTHSELVANPGSRTSHNLSIKFVTSTAFLLYAHGAWYPAQCGNRWSSRTNEPLHRLALLSKRVLHPAV